MTDPDNHPGPTCVGPSKGDVRDWAVGEGANATSSISPDRQPAPTNRPRSWAAVMSPRHAGEKDGSMGVFAWQSLQRMSMSWLRLTKSLSLIAVSCKHRQEHEQIDFPKSREEN